MPGTATELIKEKLNIVDFIRSRVPLSPAGKNFKGLCPFHREKTPSFMVSPDRQSWHCFGCGAGGDVFTFLMRFEHLEFPEALKVLAEKAGVELQRVSPAEYKLAGLLYDLNEAALAFYRKRLSESDEAQKYLADRKLKKETVEEFELGFAPNEPEALTLHFLNSGASPDDLARAGLSFKTERGLTMDRFRGRIMFPIRNHIGKAVGFTGRILPRLDDGKTGKYVNSPETPIFVKSRLLYGFYKTKDAIREAGAAFLVEGQMDFLMSYQTGVKNVVASSGTAFTPEHLRVLRRVTDRVVVSFDNDEAGLAAGEKVVDMAKANDFEVSIVSFSPHKDPAEAAASDPKKFLQAVSEAKPAMEVYLDRYLPREAGRPAGEAGRAGKNGQDFSSRENLSRLRTVLSKIRNIASPVERETWMKALSRRTGLGVAVLEEEAGQLSDTEAPRLLPVEEEGGGNVPVFSRWERVAQRLLAAAVNDDDFSRITPEYLPPSHLRVHEILRGGNKKSDDTATDSLVETILLQSEPMPEADLEFLRNELAREWVFDRRRELVAAVKAAEAEGDAPRVERLLGELARLAGAG